MRLAAILVMLFELEAGAASVHYIDNALEASANNGASWENAWTNFSSVEWTRGDMYYISGGTVSKTYAGPLTIDIPFGTETVLTTIYCGTNTPHNGKVVIDGYGTNVCMDWESQHHVFISGQINSDKQRHILLQNAGGNDPGDYVLSGWALNGRASPADHCTAEYIEITNSWNGISSALCHQTAIRNCKITGVLGDAAVMIGGAFGSPLSNTITDCEIELTVTNYTTGVGPDGIQTSGSLTVSNCLIYTKVLSGTGISGQHQDAIQHNGSDVVVDACTMLNMANSANESHGYSDTIGATNITFRNNLVWWSLSDVTNCWTRGFEWVPRVGEVTKDYYIYNNTFVDIPRWQAINFSDDVSADYPLTNVWIYNNLIVNCGYNTKAAIQVAAGANAATNTIHIDYNCLVLGTNSTSRTNIMVNGKTWTQVNARGGGPPPDFVSYVQYSAANDFQLNKDDTLARDMGTNLSSIFTTDRLGATRGSSWDIGAYEFVGHTMRATTVNSKNIRLR